MPQTPARPSSIVPIRRRAGLPAGRRVGSVAALATFLATAVLAATPVHAQDDAAMLRLAERSGCLACHHVDPGGRGADGLAPIGPAWRDVSVKYADERAMEDRLVATVLGGTSPGLSHWRGRHGGADMPANQVAISREDARLLVRWILALGPRP